MDIRLLRESVRSKHRMRVPGLGVFIAPKGVARLFQLHDYTKCPRFGVRRETSELIPLLLPNVYNSPRFQRVRRQSRDNPVVYDHTPAKPMVLKEDDEIDYLYLTDEENEIDYPYFIDEEDHLIEIDELVRVPGNPFGIPLDPPAIEEEVNEFGTCCVCEMGDMEDCGLVQLGYKMESESGWGCLQCGLPMEGAIAVVCSDCYDKYGEKIEDQIKYLIDGKKGRIPVPPVENRVPHEHDLSLHPEVNKYRRYL